MTCEGCVMYVTRDQLIALNKSYDCGDEIYPLNEEWSQCLDGPDKWLNCRRRKPNHSLEETTE